MSSVVLASRKLFGLLELDPAGLVLYSRMEPGGDSTARSGDVTGRNFYTEIAPFENVGEFRERLADFSDSGRQAESIQFTCRYADGPVPVKILLARIRERAEREVTK